jgi:FkbM family methyltransferase
MKENMVDKKVKFNIGANNGDGLTDMATDDSIVYAFEPTRELLIKFLWPIQDKHDNIFVFPHAIDIENGFKHFNIAGNGDWGCSSLHEFSDDLNEKWKGSWNFKMTHSYTVPTITLYDFCNMYNITEIDFLHCDTQGNDFNVLKSLGNKIGIIKEGVVEVAMEVDLYKNVNNRIEDVTEFLISNGFQIIKIEQNDPYDAEINLHFKRN